MDNKNKRTFARRLGESEGEEMRERMIILPVTLHQEMKSRSDDLRINVRDAYAEAAKAWLDKDKSAAGDFPRITKEQERLLADILILYSKRKQHVLADNTILSIKTLIRSALSSVERL